MTVSMTADMSTTTVTISVGVAYKVVYEIQGTATTTTTLTGTDLYRTTPEYVTSHYEDARITIINTTNAMPDELTEWLRSVPQEPRNRFWWRDPPALADIRRMIEPSVNRSLVTRPAYLAWSARAHSRRVDIRASFNSRVRRARKAKKD